MKIMIGSVDAATKPSTFDTTKFTNPMESRPLQRIRPRPIMMHISLMYANPSHTTSWASSVLNTPVMQ